MNLKIVHIRLFGALVALMLAGQTDCFGQTGASPKQPGAIGPTKKTRAMASHPAEFKVARMQFDKVYTMKEGDVLAIKGSTQLDQAKALINTRNGDMQFVRLKLRGIPKAYLVVQVNGGYSTHVFILSDDHSVSYKGRITENEVQFKKCDEDEIVSE
jgi:hypothetical protein